MRSMPSGLILLVAVLALVAAGCGTRTAGPAPKPVAMSTPSGEDKVSAMDEGHEAGVKAFPAKTEGRGAQPLHPEV
ncbi:MAG: hypothetical protein ACRDFW_11095, partial [bacterium]